MAIKNAFYAQSGGVTSVINATACGVIQTAKKQGIKINTIPGNVWNNNMFKRGEHLVKY